MFKIKNFIFLIAIAFITFSNATQKNLITEDIVKSNISQENIIEENIIKEDVTQKNIIKKVIIQESIIQKNILPNSYMPSDILVGFYGRPYSKTLGILGEYDIEELTQKMKAIKKEYEQISNGIKVVPTYHIIKDIATLEAGNDGDHIKPLNEALIMKYINKAQEENFAVILDVQLGTMSPIEAIKPILKFLKYPNVHLAIDPEFKIPTHKKFPPGKFIGHIFAKDVNEVQEAMQNFLTENNIKGKRMLLVHMFYKRMLRSKNEIKNYDSINLLYNIDGHGRGPTKIQIYNHLYNKEANKVAQGGFKVFYKNDIKPLLTPRQIFGLEPVRGALIWKRPNYINYH